MSGSQISKASQLLMETLVFNLNIFMCFNTRAGMPWARLSSGAVPFLSGVRPKL